MIQRFVTMRVSGMLVFMGLAALVAPASAEVAIGVTAFERVAARGQVVPDVATRLAQRLGTRGVERVVGPSEMGVAPTSVASAQEAVGWAKEAAVAAIVVGKTTRLGRSLSVDARLYDAAGNMLGGPLVEEVTRVEDLGRAIEALAEQVVERVGEGGAVAPQVASRPPTATATAPVASGASGERYSDKSPISIKADQLESLSEGDRRKFIFRGNVRAVQDDLTVLSNKMVAFYPPGSSSPDRMVATGRVQLEQTDRVAHCTKAIFYRADQRVECTGKLAELEQGCDRVRGEMITFHLDTEVMHVEGAADVQIRPDEPGCSDGQVAGGGQ
ncbi:MAG: hypothetical protein GY723_05580 [bacterium]|nr:hypothetical protein [bacterium]MCP5070728.1 hypothetical protein [bacterium]